MISSRFDFFYENEKIPKLTKIDKSNTQRVECYEQNLN